MKIQVLGSGCKTCKVLHEYVVQAVNELNLTVDVEYITDVQKIITLGFMSSPIVIINDAPVLVGKTATVDELKKLIVAAQ